MTDKNYERLHAGLSQLYDRLWWVALWCFVIACNTCEISEKLT
jgi:hypothetical protein